MGETVHLRGVAWNHTRGFLPMVAAAQRFEDLLEGIRITWEKRSLQSFGDEGLDAALERFDLLVIDHPYVGQFASRPLVQPLDEHLSSEFISDLRSNSVGRSFESYCFDGHLWAAPIDAAAPVSSSRDDLLRKAGLSPPESWEDLCGLARRGMVVVPATPVDSLMNFYMLCCGLGEEPWRKGGRLATRETGTEALRLLGELIGLCSSECLNRNPIETYRELVTGREAVYCPFAFGYSNYSRAGYAPATLMFGDTVTLNGGPLRSTLGGAGLAVSTRYSHLPWALRFLEYIAGEPFQRSLYYSAGGQPAHRSAWLDPNINEDCREYFTNTLPALDRAYLRPRQNGYLQFQQDAGLAIHKFLGERGNPRDTFDKLESCLAFVI